MKTYYSEFLARRWCRLGQVKRANPVNAGPFGPERRVEGCGWPAEGHTMIGVQRFENV
jgi:hypothetical protein